MLPSWKNVVVTDNVEIIWPISYGTTVEVSCLKHHKNSGDEVVTCIGEDQFLGQPKCSKISTYRSFPFLSHQNLIK